MYKIMDLTALLMMTDQTQSLQMFIILAIPFGVSRDAEIIYFTL